MRLILISFALLLWNAASARPNSETLMYAGKVGEALSAARREAGEDPTDIDAQERFIDIMLTIGLANEVIRYYEERVSERPIEADSHYLLGRAVISAKDAKASYERALRLDADHARSHMGVAAIHVATNHVDLAEAAYREALARDKSLAEAWQGLARLLAVEGRLTDALTVAREALEHVPNRADPYLTIAVLSPTESKEILEMATTRAGDDPRVHARLAELHLVDGNSAAALQSAQRALAIDPKMPDANLSAMYAKDLETGALDLPGYRTVLKARDLEGAKPAEAMEQYYEVTTKYPRCLLAWMALSRLRLQLGDTERALQDLAAAVAIDGENGEALSAYGLLLLKNQAFAEAQPILVKARGMRPYDASIAIGAGNASLAMGQQKEAIEILQKAYARFPYDVRVPLAYGKALSDIGEVEAAYRVIRDAAAKFPDPLLAVALVAAAQDAGRYLEAAEILQKLGEANHSTKLLDAAQRLRELAKTQP
ncbi:MAG: tetratricopeptide repeat protein [Proteobacteria bacterium]|jgi:tetratricopeptide (TPR) repeat protein|nr:tetratricopeptide repeat protein [Pseudomonadota bacterium]